MRKVLTIVTVFLLLLSLAFSSSAASTDYVIDDANLLSWEQQNELSNYAELITNKYGIGIYIMTMEDYRDYGTDSMIFDVLWNYYHANELGYGPDREGMILMLSMNERDYATFFYGERTEYAFNAFGQAEHEAYFLDNFAEDDWFGGFEDYLTYAEDFMARAEAGEPVRENPWNFALIFILIAIVISLVVTLILWAGMSNVAVQKGAASYQTSQGLVLTHRMDLFINQTVVRRKIETSSSSSSSGSRAHSGGGGSGRSGKF